MKSPAFWTGLIGVLGAFAVGMAQLFGVDITAEAGSWQQALTAWSPPYLACWPGGCYHRPNH